MARKTKKQISPFQESMHRLGKNKLAMASLVVIIFLLLIAACADFIVPYELAITNNAATKLAAPSVEHIFGCDNLGRDVFARVIHGSRVSLLLGFGATALTTIVATLLGTSVAYYGGKFDNIVMRILDALISIPIILLALAIAAGFGVGMIQLIISIFIGQIASFTRVVRSSALNVVNQEYVESSKVIGLGSLKTIITQIIPNVMGTVLVQFTMTVSENILMASTLSFLGLGVKVPVPEWGKIVSDGLSVIRYSSHMVIFPTIFISVTALAINLLGDGLRDALDPSMKGKR